MNGDGTQAPEPPRAYTDPLAGLAGSGRAEAGFATTGTDRDDALDVEIAEPVQPDPDVVRDMVNAALAEEEKAGKGGGSTGDAAEGPVEPGQSAVPAAPPQSGPPHPAWRAPGQLLPQVLRRRRKPAQQEAKPARPFLRKPSNGSAGVAVALVLLLVFVIVAIQFLSSLFESISGIFQ
ncbi:hypothetical protein B0I33_102663 [Prauserella shujinwangii]|uniref:Uncharacterized protein n=1 Tax=Prauserella shujinwangii TaxID=1453103 RepID=A0A2T0M1R5_9PSEU|nr:hypothetical protein [Prauserella shujinwangii]PRX50539.1 hypothetical protein B0I33_102663 [Prauserella shujinwangii]